MLLLYHKRREKEVALLAEGVDRNQHETERIPAHRVALLAEGVDRNFLAPCTMESGWRRPPRGGRG